MDLTSHDYAVAAAAIRRYAIRPTTILKHLRPRGVKPYKVYEALRGFIDYKYVSDIEIQILLCGISERLMKCRQAALLFASNKYGKEELKTLLGAEYWKYYHAFAGMKHAAGKSRTRKVNPILFRTLSTPVCGKAKTSLGVIIALLNAYTPKQIRMHIHASRKHRKPNWRPSRVTYAAIKRLTAAGLTLDDMTLPYEEIKDKAVEYYFKNIVGIEAGDIEAFLRDVYEKGTVKANLSEYKWLKQYRKFRYLLVGTFELPSVKTLTEFKGVVYARAWSLINYRKTGLNRELHEVGEDLALTMRPSLPKIEKEDIPNTEEGMLYMIRKIGRMGYKQALKTTRCTGSKGGQGFKRYQLESLIRSVGMTPNKFKVWLRTHDISNVQSLDELRQLAPPKIKNRQPQVTDNWIPQVKDLMRQRLDGVQIYKKIKVQGYSGSLVTLQRAIRKIRAAENTISVLMRRIHERRQRETETKRFAA